MTQLDDLSDDCWIEVLDRLAPEHLFKMQHVNRRLRRLAAVKMRVKIKAIALSLSYKHFSDCAHLKDVSRDQVLVLELVLRHGITKKAFHKPTIRNLFLDVLSKCPNVKSLDLRCCELSGDFFLEVVRRCPQLECVRFVPLVKDEDWDMVLDQIGHQVVHIVKDRHMNVRSDHQLLATLAKKCPDIRRLDCHEYYLSSDLVTALKLLPTNCWIALNCDAFVDDQFEDVVDELNVFELDWPAFGKRVEKLSSLKFVKMVYDDLPEDSVDFAGLKKLDVSEWRLNQESVKILEASRFPRLEEFCFSASRRLFEDDFKAMFQQMPLVKKLTVVWEVPICQHVVAQLPGTAIHQLKKLEAIDLEIVANWEVEDLHQQLDQYVDEISSLKKLTVKAKCWLTVTFINEVRRMKLRQDRVEVVLVHRNSYFDN